MQTYSKFRPTDLDIAGLGCPDQQDWLVAPVSVNRDSGPLERSNWRIVLQDLESYDTGEDLQVHRFGHWGPGWFEIILIRPGTKCAKIAEQWENALADYPVACESDYSELEYEEAQSIWENCYNNKERLEYIRENYSDFEPRSFAELLSCVRGKFFLGYASELLG